MIKEKIIEIFEQNGVCVSEEGTLEDMDSLQFISSIVSIEQDFEIEFPDEFLAIENQYTIDLVVATVTNELEKANG